MPPERIDASSFSPDIQEFLRLLSAHGVKAMIVGGEAVIFYGHIRVTGDIDVFYDRSPENADRLFRVLEEFWQGAIPNLENPSDLEAHGVIFQFGVPPNRIDLLNHIDGVAFDSAWSGRKLAEFRGESESVELSYIGLEELIQNKKASGRPKDLEDLPFLLEARHTSRNTS